MSRAAGPFTPRRTHAVTHHELWYRYVPESGNWHGGTLTRWMAALSAAPLSLVSSFPTSADGKHANVLCKWNRHFLFEVFLHLLSMAVVAVRDVRLIDDRGIIIQVNFCQNCIGTLPIIDGLTEFPDLTPQSNRSQVFRRY